MVITPGIKSTFWPILLMAVIPSTVVTTRLHDAGRHTEYWFALFVSVVLAWHAGRLSAWLDYRWWKKPEKEK